MILNFILSSAASLSWYSTTFIKFFDICVPMNIPIVFHVLSATQRPSLPKPLNTEEEQLMRVFYEQKIQEVCAAFGFPHKIQVNKFVP